MGPCCLLGGSLPPPRRGGEVCRRNPHNGREMLALSSSAPSEMPAARGTNINHRQRRLMCKEPRHGTEAVSLHLPADESRAPASRQPQSKGGSQAGCRAPFVTTRTQGAPSNHTPLILRYSYSPLSPLLPSPHLHTPGAEQGLAVILARFLSQGSRGTGLAWHGHAVGLGMGQTAGGSGNALSVFF